MSAAKLLRAKLLEAKPPGFGSCQVQHPFHGQVVVTCRVPERIPARNLTRLSDQGRLWFDEEGWCLVVRPRVRLVADRGRAA